MRISWRTRRNWLPLIIASFRYFLDIEWKLKSYSITMESIERDAANKLTFLDSLYHQCFTYEWRKQEDLFHVVIYSWCMYDINFLSFFAKHFQNKFHIFIVTFLPMTIYPMMVSDLWPMFCFLCSIEKFIFLIGTILIFYEV